MKDRESFREQLAAALARIKVENAGARSFMRDVQKLPLQGPLPEDPTRVPPKYRLLNPRLMDPGFLASLFTDRPVPKIEKKRRRTKKSAR